MIETMVLKYLAENLDVPVSMEEPEEKPTSYVIIEKTGGGMENQIHNATLAIQGYAETLYKAAQLNEEVKSLMLAMPDEEDVGYVGLQSDYNFTDPSTKRYRYQSVWDIVY